MDFRINGLRLRTPRLLLRAFEPGDLEDFYAYARVEGVGEMAGWLHHTDRDTTRRVLQSFIEEDRVFALEYEGHAVGSLELESVDVLGKNGGRIGFVLARHLHRQGLMSEALQVLLSYAFENVGMDYIYSGYFQDNAASEATHRRLGFVYCGQQSTRHANGLDLLTDRVIRVNPRYVEQTAAGLRKALEVQADPKRQTFDRKLIPNLAPERMLGISNPPIQQLAKQLSPLERFAYWQSLPHHYHDENMLHAMLLRREKDERLILDQLERFLPYIDNWAVCDSLDFRRFQKERSLLWQRVQSWRSSPAEYTRRMALIAIMGSFLETDYIDAVCEILPRIEDTAYYVHMALAWTVAEGLLKQYDRVLPLLLEHRLSQKTHNKAIQKAIESLRIPAETKQYLKTLKRK